MGQDPDAIREEIEQTRSDLGETVEAVGYKADVPSRAKDAVSDKVESVKSKVSDTATRAKEAVVGTASRAGDATPSRGQVKQTGRRAAGLAKENPLGLASPTWDAVPVTASLARVAVSLTLDFTPSTFSLTASLAREGTSAL